MKRWIHAAEEFQKFIPDDNSERGLKVTDFVTHVSGIKRGSARVYADRFGGLWYRLGNTWHRTYSDYCTLSNYRKYAEYSIDELEELEEEMLKPYKEYEKREAQNICDRRTI